MKTTNITKFWNKNKTPILVAIAVIVAVVVVWIIFKRMSERMKKTNATTQKTAVETMTGQTVSNGLNFDDMAQRMFTAWIATFGTDENEVYSILGQLNNQADWEYLKARYEAYWNSLPTYEQFIHTTAGLGLSGTLVSDMRRELNKTELQRCRDILNGKNIIPDF